MRTSRSVRPGEERRRCCNSSWLVAGRESIRMLRTPSCSMKRSDSSLRARADGQHADHRAHAEHDAQRGQQRARLLRAQVVGRQQEGRRSFAGKRLQSASALLFPG